MVYANCNNAALRPLTWNDIVSGVESLQKQDSNSNSNSSTNEERVIIEGSGYEARLVVHMQTTRKGIERTIELIKQVIQKKQGQ